MKVFKVLSSFIIFYFIIVASQSMIELAKWISFGNEIIEYGFYVFIVILFIYFIALPIMLYFNRPSTSDYKKVFKNDPKYIKKVSKYLLKNLPIEDKLEFKSKEENSDKVKWIRLYLERQCDKFKKISSTYALNVTSTVLLSPNSFIDGITILYGNSKLMHDLSKSVCIRYDFKELSYMYLSTLKVASISGLIEEFDDVLIDALEELLEEIAESIGDETGKAITDSIPFVNIAAKATSFIVQSAGNYAYIMYNAKKFECMVRNIYLEDELTIREIGRLARKSARMSKFEYIKDLSSGIKKKTSIKKSKKGLF